MFIQDDNGVPQTEPWVTFFFVSYYVIANIVLMNVVVAVLLDEFISSVGREKDAAALVKELENAKRRITGVLDPITMQLTGFESRENLDERIDELYTQLDRDGSGGLNFEEFKQGVNELPGFSSIHMTQPDFDCITDNGRHLSSEGEFNKEQFREMMKDEFKRFFHRQLANNLAESHSKEFKSSVTKIMRVCVCVCVSVCLCVCVCACARCVRNVGLHVYVYTCVYTCVYPHTHIHTYIYRYMH